MNAHAGKKRNKQRETYGSFDAKVGLKVSEMSEIGGIQGIACLDCITMNMEGETQQQRGQDVYVSFQRTVINCIWIMHYCKIWVLFRRRP